MSNFNEADTSATNAAWTGWRPAQRAARMNPSVLREILKVTERPGMLSLAGGLPSPESFPVEAMRAACARVLELAPREALQYAASEGYGPLREWVAEHLRGQGMTVDADQVLITTGSQQGLDLVAKVMVDSGAPVAVEAPTYLGALQAFAPMEPTFVSVPSDAQGPLPEAVAALPEHAPGVRFLYVLPNFQNPSSRVMSEARREALVAAARQAGVPLVEDNPYGDLWYDAPPPAPLAARWPEGVIYLGSFSKVLAPGLRLGYLVAPKALFPKLLQAKQAADLHTPGFNQRLVHEVIRDGFLDTHVPAIRVRYREQRDAMQAALLRHLPPGSQWQAPQGGMFFWVRLPGGLNAQALFDKAVAAGVAFVPGAAFYVDEPDEATLRLSFVTLTPQQIEQAVALLGQVLASALREQAVWSRSALEAAAQVVHAVMPPTPQYRWPLLEAQWAAQPGDGTELWVKHENHTPVGAFKVRGGLVFLERLLRSGARPAGLVSATRGNHGQSIGLAAQRHGLPAVIVVPHGNSREKNAAMRALGVELIEHGEDFQAAKEHAETLAQDRGWTLVPSFHPDLVAGVASYALELFGAAPQLQTVYVPIGLGSGACGVIAARDALGLDCEVVGVVSAGAPAYALSWAARQPLSHAVSTQLADGMACRTPVPEALEMLLGGLSRIVTVTDDEVAQAMRRLFECTHQVAEGAGAAALAAAWQERARLAGRRTAVVLSGGNVDREVYAQVLQG